MASFSNDGVDGSDGSDDGADGADGADVADGADGADRADGANNSEGSGDAATLSRRLDGDGGGGLPPSTSIAMTVRSGDARFEGISVPPLTVDNTQYNEAVEGECCGGGGGGCWCWCWSWC